MEYELSSWGGRINLFGQTHKFNISLFETFEQLNQMGLRAPCSIQFPGNEGVSWSHICQRFVESFALCF
jgi:hypothetical protein